MPKSPLFMGVINMTPDSFSGDGLKGKVETALERVETLVREGASIIDIGGESTRPGSAAVTTQEEIERTLPIIERVRKRFDAQISIDTQKAEVAEAALRAGAHLVNDISAGGDPKMAQVVARYGATVVLMHMQGTPQTMQNSPSYPEGVVFEVAKFLMERGQLFENQGVSREKIWVDPGIGFGKTLEHNLALLKDLRAFSKLGERLVIGTSRKSFLARLLGDPLLPMPLRSEGTLASNLWAWTQGASVFRVHDVGALKRAFATWEAILSVIPSH